MRWNEMKSRASMLSWPLRCLPVPVAQHVGTFPMMVPGCNTSYCSSTIAIHLYDYPADIWIGRKHYRVRPGDITLSPRGVWSRYDLKESGSHLCIHFFPPASEATAPGVRLPLHIRLGPQTAAARERFWRIIDHTRHSGGDPDSPEGCAASASLQEFLLWLHFQCKRGATPRRGSLVEEALRKLSHAIETSLGKPMLIGDLAADAGLSSDYVARLFARRYGMTLQHYLLLRRVEVARHLLISSNLLVSEIGRQVGMPDPQYFNKQFRRVTGQSPLAYRRSQVQGSSRATGTRSRPLISVKRRRRLRSDRLPPSREIPEASGKRHRREE
jgi:AraC-like DNA-binding protein